MSLEKTVLEPPRGFVLGFFDRLSAAFERWGIGRHRALRKVMKGRTMAALPASTLSCPGWFAADAAGMLADQAPPSAAVIPGLLDGLENVERLMARWLPRVAPPVRKRLSARNA